MLACKESKSDLILGLLMTPTNIKKLRKLAVKLSVEWCNTVKTEVNTTIESVNFEVKDFRSISFLEKSQIIATVSNRKRLIPNAF